MATWIAHLRIAENLLSYGFVLAVEPFLLGNIAPDSGVSDGNGDWLPHKNMTHWRDANHFQPENFYNAYIAGNDLDLERLSFLIGYYAHLVADIDWIANIWQPLKHDNPELADRLKTDPDFAWAIKKDWYGQDFIVCKQGLKPRPSGGSFQHGVLLCQNWKAKLDRSAKRTLYSHYD
jgi:hypothetical protein